MELLIKLFFHIICTTFLGFILHIIGVVNPAMFAALDCVIYQYSTSIIDLDLARSLLNDIGIGVRNDAEKLTLSLAARHRMLRYGSTQERLYDNLGDLIKQRKHDW